MAFWRSCMLVDVTGSGFDLPRQQWSLLNRFRTEQGHCGACRRKWRLTDTDLCFCDPDDVSHCRILSSEKTEWRLISVTLCGWRRCFVTDQLWLMKRIQIAFSEQSLQPFFWKILQQLFGIQNQVSSVSQSELLSSCDILPITKVIGLTAIMT